MAKHELKTKKGYFYFKRLEQMHPMHTLVYLFLLLSFIAFIFSIYFFEIKVINVHLNLSSVRLPDLYVLGAFVLFASMFLAFDQKQLYKREKIRKLKINFYANIFISAIFIILQLVASYQVQIGFLEKENQEIISYIIYITGMHLIHLIIVQVFSIYVLFRIVSAADDPVKTLVYVTNPFEKLLIDINSKLWVYQSAMWICLYLYLTFRF